MAPPLAALLAAGGAEALSQAKDAADRFSLHNPQLKSRLQQVAARSASELLRSGLSANTLRSVAKSAGHGALRALAGYDPRDRASIKGTGNLLMGVAKNFYNTGFRGKSGLKKSRARPLVPQQALQYLQEID